MAGTEIRAMLRNRGALTENINQTDAITTDEQNTECSYDCSIFFTRHSKEYLIFVLLRYLDRYQ